MSIFSKIRDKIFGKKQETTVDDLRDAGMLDTPTATTAAPSPAPTLRQVDVEQVLEAKLAEKGSPDLNWRSSIVDLMKLLDIDSSLDNRKELATELGYTGEKNGSAEMNIWLHKAVMTQLAANGGIVPAGLTD